MTSLPDVPFGPADLPTLGLTRDDLRIRIKNGDVRRVFRGVYVTTWTPDSLQLRAACAARVLPGHCVVSDRSAAWLHGVDPYTLAEKSGPPPVLEVVSAAGLPTERHHIRGGKRSLLPEDIMELHGIRVTTPLRTACDVASLHGRSNAMAVLNSFARHHGITQTQIRTLLPRLAGRRGVKQLRELTAYMTPHAESHGESWIQLAIIDAGFPQPIPQVRVALPGFGWVFLDWAWEHLKVAVEYDGEEFHSSPGDREHDRIRREALAAAGWIVIVVRKDGFNGPGLDRWVSALRQAFAERQPRRPAKRKYSRGESRTPYGRAS